MKTAYILCGSNIGQRAKQIYTATQKIQKNIGLVVSSSSIIETKPWGVTNQPLFLNQCLKITTQYTSIELLHSLQQIEVEMGKIISYKWGPRNIDLDILFYEDEITHTKYLQIPHPFFLERQFAIQCMNEIAPNFIHPIKKRKIKDMFNALHLSSTT